MPRPQQPHSSLQGQSQLAGRLGLWVEIKEEREQACLSEIKLDSEALHSICLFDHKSLWKIKSCWPQCIYSSGRHTLALCDCEWFLFGWIYIFGGAEFNISMAKLYFGIGAKLSSNLIYNWWWLFSHICHRTFASQKDKNKKYLTNAFSRLNLKDLNCII